MLFLIFSGVLQDLNNEIDKLTQKISNYVVIVNANAGKGTGTIINENNIITSGIFSFGEEVEIIFKNGKKMKGKITGYDEFSGITLIEVKSKLVPPEKSSRIQERSLCIVYGNSLGRLGTIGIGVIESSKNTYNVIVPLNLGNNGSGVFDIDGKLIGIIGGIFSSLKDEKKGNENIRFFAQGNIAFIIPNNLIERIIEKIKTYGTIKRGYLGISVDYIDKNVVIKEVAKNSPAENFGLKVGDKIISINGRKVTSLDFLIDEISTMESGTIVKLSIIRGFTKREISVILGEKPTSNFGDDYIIKGYENQ
uniref:PDZ domain-containing protein n=1 Tax=candidate division WOR-3 bacterium TaxID=2052148 RepID=A0A7C4U725_UNCW3